MTLRSTRAELSPLALLAYATSAIAMLGSAAISPILPVMVTELGVSEVEIGLMMTLFTLPVVFAVPVQGWLADHVGRRPVLAGNLFLFGASGVAVFFVSDFAVILGLRALQGVGFSGIVPLVVALLGDMYEGAEEVGAQGWRVTFVNLGAFAFPIVVGYLAAVAWNLPFLLFAAAVPAGLAVLRYFPDVGATYTPPERYVRAVATAAWNPSIAAAFVVGFARFFSLYALYTFLPLLIVERGLQAAQVGLVVGAINGAKMLVATQSRRTLSVGSPRTTMVVAFLASAVAVAGFFLADGFAAFLVVAAAFGACEGVTAPLQKTVLTRHAAAQVRAGVVSFNAVLQNVGKTLGPLVLGLVVSGVSLAAVFLALGVVGVVAGALVSVGLFGLDRGHAGVGRAD